MSRWIGKSKRYFNPEWYDMHLNWLEYSEVEDEAYCSCCYLLNSSMRKASWDETKICSSLYFYLSMFAFSLYLNMGFFPAAKARIKDVPRKGTTHSYLSSYSAFSGQYTFILAMDLS